jgi:undecaprenyl-diphosphatase
MNQPLTRVRLRPRTNLTQTVAFAATCLFIVISFALLLKDPALERFDLWLGELIRSTRSEFGNVLAVAFDVLGSTTGFAVITLLLALLFVARRRIASAMLLVLSVGGAYLLNTLFKTWIERPRPNIDALFPAEGFSFPSGNSTMAVALFGYAAIALIDLFQGGKSAKAWCLTIASLLILLIGFFRVYAGVHYPSDIIAGYFLGAAWLFVVLHLHRAYDA